MLCWTPKTDCLLRHGGECGCGYDIIDHAFGGAFPLRLLNELRSDGWIDDPSSQSGVGGRGRLRPARTKMDADVDALLRGLMGDQFGLSRKEDNAGGTTRGDESAFVSRRERMEASFAERCPLLHQLVSTIESTACDRLGESTRTAADCAHKTNNATMYFEFDTRLTSVQIAKYPGDGQSGYLRHCDRKATCAREPNDPTKQTSKDVSSERILTFVYYLTPPDWDAELDGGALRMFSQGTAGDYDDDVDDARHYFDVTPFSDRLIVFRSDLVEHAVMPSLRRDRIAITVWLYGRAIVHREARAEELGDPISERIVCNDASILDREGRGEGDAGSDLPPPLPMISTNDGDASTVVEATGKKTGDEATIFVAIPSYRDEETWPTIESLIETAFRPERVYVGVVYQVDTTSQDEVRRLTIPKSGGVLPWKNSHWSLDKHLRSIMLDYRHATGPCYARHLAQTLHRGESHVLQIDSHMRFRPNWDEYLIQQLSKTERPNDSVLTTYPPGYDPPNGPGRLGETRPTVLVPWKFGLEDGMLRQKGRLVRSGHRRTGDRNDDGYNDNIPCLLYAGGFNFFRSPILEKCPYDSKLHGLFFGEEISMAVRLYTHGVRLFAPPQTVCYHLWKRNPLRVMDNINGSNDNNVAKPREDVLEVVRAQLRGSGRGLGTVRSAEQFGEELGVDFEKQSLVPGCEDAGLGDSAFVSSAPSSLMIEDMVDNEREGLGNIMGIDDMSSVLKLVEKFMRK